MIYFTTFILALFFSQMAHAVPQACGDAVPPELPTPAEHWQFNLPIAAPTVVTHNKKYDDPNGAIKDVACARLYPPNYKFHNIPSYPRIGGAFDIHRFPPGPSCGLCWKLTNLDNGKSIVITAIDHADQGFVISEAAFRILSGGPLPPKLENVGYHVVDRSACGL